MTCGRVVLSLALIVTLTSRPATTAAQGVCRRSCEAGEGRDIHGCCVARKKPKRRPRDETPPPAPTASVLVMADVAGAEVWVDGRRIGYAPALADGLAIGRHSIDVRRGADLWSDSVTLAAGASETVIARLAALSEPSTVPEPALSVAEPEPDIALHEWPALERAIELYRTEKYFPATVALQQILDDERAPRKIKDRTQFFLGKTLYWLAFYAVSANYFDTIAQAGPDHDYFGAGLKWLTALTRVVRSPAVAPSLGRYPPEVLDEPTFESVRDELRYLLGRRLAASGFPEQAEAMLRRVDAASEFIAPAELERARLRAAAGDLDGASAHVLFAARNPALAFPVILEVASWSDAPATDRTIAALVAARGPVAGLAALERSRRNAASLADVSAPGFYAVALGTGCGRGATDDFFTASAPVREELRAMVQTTTTDDNAEVYMRFAALLAQPSTRTRDAIVAVLQATDPRLDEGLAWIQEIETERGLFDRTDAAWQSSAVGVNLIQELELARSLAQADAGVVLRARLGHLDDDIALIEEAAAAQPARISLGDRGDLVVTGDACAALATASTQRGGKFVAARKGGCAGCGAGDASAWFAAVGLAALALLVRRRRPAQRAQRKPTN